MDHFFLCSGSLSVTIDLFARPVVNCIFGAGVIRLGDRIVQDQVSADLRIGVLPRLPDAVPFLLFRLGNLHCLSANCLHKFLKLSTPSDSSPSRNARTALPGDVPVPDHISCRHAKLLHEVSDQLLCRGDCLFCELPVLAIVMRADLYSDRVAVRTFAVIRMMT